MRWPQYGGRVAWMILFIISLINESEASVTFTPSISIGERYNDNLLFSGTDKKSDFATLISPAGIFTYEGKQLTLSCGYDGTGEFYLYNKDFNRYSQNASISLFTQTFKELDVRLTESVTYTPELPAFSFDTVRESNEGIQLARTDTLRNRATLAVSYNWFPEVNMALSYTNTITSYEAPALQDSIVHDTSLQMGYQWSARTRWMISYRNGITIYDRGNDIITHQFSIGTGHQMNNTLSLNGNLGIILYEGESRELTTDISIMKSYESGSMTLGYTRGEGTGGGLAATATINQSLSGRITERLGNNTSAYMQLAYGRNESVSVRTLQISSYNGSVGINTKLLSWLDGSITYSYFKQDAEGATGSDGERNLAMITLTATSLPWRL
jgi:hypothetical protein